MAQGYRYYPATKGGSSSFLYAFPRHVVKAELDAIRRESGIQKMPPFIEAMVGKIVTQLEQNLAEEFAKTVRRALETGGMTHGISGRKGIDFQPGGNTFKAGPRLFRPNPDVTAAFKSFTTSRSSTLTTPSRFKLQLLPGNVSPLTTIPSAYRPPRDPAGSVAFLNEDLEPFWPLQPYFLGRIPTNSVNVAAAIEYGNRFTRIGPTWQGINRTYTVGFHPFEGAIKGNIDNAIKLYTQAIKRVFRTEGMIRYKGRKLTLPVFLKQLLADQIEHELENDVKVHEKAKASPDKLKQSIVSSEHKTLRTNLERILPKNSRTLKFLDRNMLVKLQAQRRTSRNNVYGFAMDPKWFQQADFELPGGLS